MNKRQRHCKGCQCDDAKAMKREIERHRDVPRSVFPPLYRTYLATMPRWITTSVNA